MGNESALTSWVRLSVRRCARVSLTAGWSARRGCLLSDALARLSAPPPQLAKAHVERLELCPRFAEQKHGRHRPPPLRGTQRSSHLVDGGDRSHEATA